MDSDLRSWAIVAYTVRKFNWWLYCLALYDNIFAPIPLFDETLRHTLLEKQSKFPRYNMKCRGNPDTTWNIPRSIRFSPLHFMLYRGKSITFGTVCYPSADQLLSLSWSRSDFQLFNCWSLADKIMISEWSPADQLRTQRLISFWPPQE